MAMVQSAFCCIRAGMATGPHSRSRRVVSQPTAGQVPACRATLASCCRMTGDSGAVLLTPSSVTSGHTRQDRRGEKEVKRKDEGSKGRGFGGARRAENGAGRSAEASAAVSAGLRAEDEAGLEAEVTAGVGAALRAGVQAALTAANQAAISPAEAPAFIARLKPADIAAVSPALSAGRRARGGAIPRIRPNLPSWPGCAGYAIPADSGPALTAS